MTPTKEQLADPKWWDENVPEGTTHIAHGSCPIKISGQCVYFFASEAGEWRPNGCMLANYAECRLDARYKWTGPQDGLPPVGTRVDVVDNGTLMYGQGESGEVVAHVEDTAVVRMSYGLGCFESRCLRPAMTLEQVWANKRSQECDRMYGVMTSVERKGNLSDMAEAL
ncbi:MAG: hypothetical protein ACREBG_10790 [Pyrinomonadaceae bacterium]